MAEMPSLLTPVRSSFFFARVRPWLIVLGILGTLATGIVAYTAPTMVWLPVLVFLLLAALVLADAAVAVRKERYDLRTHAIVARSGGLFTERQVDLDLRNVTHVRQHLPWLRYRFFNVGDVLIESAGSSQSQVVLRSVRDPDGVYAMIRERLRANGYSLQRQQLRYETQPDAVGVVVDVVRLLVGILAVGAWVSVSIVLEFAGGADMVRQMVRGDTSGLSPGVVSVALYAVPLLVLGWGIPFVVLRYLDLRRRTYRVFDDVVEYEEGFLSRTNAFIPYENIADADLAKTLVDQVLGLADVKVSCQGSGQEVKFLRLRNGERMTAAIAQLVNAASEARRARAPSQPAQREAADALRPRVGAEAPTLLDPALAWTATLRPVPLRAIATYFWLLPFVPFSLLMIGGAWFHAKAAQYSVRPTSVGVRAGIFSISEREFSYEKVTGVVVHSSPFDRVFGTITVEIWSIGASAPLVLAHVPEADVDVVRLLRNLGVERTPPAHTLATAFGLGVWLRASLPGMIWLGVLLLSLVALGVLFQELAMAGVVVSLLVLLLATFVWRQAWMTRQSFTLHASHVELRTGIWWRAHTYVRYDNMKKTEVTRFPGGRAGSLRLYVAGERMVQQQNNQKGAAVPYSLLVRFVADTSDLGARLDEVISRVRDAGDVSPVAAPVVTLAAQPAVSNTMIGAVAMSLLFPPAAPLALVLSYLRVRRRHYRLEADRVVSTEGLMFHKQSSVLFERIDSIRQDQGLLGKMLGNGRVTIFTAGSSRPDLVLDALRDHRSAYEMLRARYQQGDWG